MKGGQELIAELRAEVERLQRKVDINNKHEQRWADEVMRYQAENARERDYWRRDNKVTYEHKEKLRNRLAKIEALHEDHHTYEEESTGDRWQECDTCHEKSPCDTLRLARGESE